MKHVLFAAIVACTVASCSDDPTAPDARVNNIAPLPRIAFSYVVGGLTITKLSLPSPSIGGISPNGRYVAISASTFTFEPYLFDVTTSTLTPLPNPLGYFGPQAVFANNDGSVIGNANNADYSVVKPFCWCGGVQVELPLPAGYTSGQAVDMGSGARPLIIGYTYFEDEAHPPRPLLWQFDADGDPVVTVLDYGAWGASAYAIDENAGIIVGSLKGEFYSTTTLAKWSIADRSLTTLALSLDPIDVNAAGTMLVSDNDENYFLVTADGSSTPLADPDFPTADFGQYIAWGGINDAGLVTGWYQAGWTTSQRPVVYYQGEVMYASSDPTLNGFFIGVSNNNRSGWIYGDEVGIASFSLLDDADAPPTITSATVNRYTMPEGGEFRLRSEATDALGRRIHYNWAFSDGTSATTRNVSKSFSQDGSYTATLSVDNGNGATDTRTFNLTVTNVLPTVTATPSSSSPETGDAFSLQIDAADPGDALAVAVNWGDGSAVEQINCASPCSWTPTHIFKVAATRNVRVTVSDDDGARSVRTPVTVTTRNVALDLHPRTARPDVVDLDDDAQTYIVIAVLGTAGLTALDMDEDQIRLSVVGGQPVRAAGRQPNVDVNGDGIPDARFKFRREALVAAGMNHTPFTFVLTGKSIDGVVFSGQLADVELTPLFS